jgi:hypothetical protein
MRAIRLRCPLCRRFPIRLEANNFTWLECSPCGLQGGKFNTMSNSFAYTQSINSWNVRAILAAEDLFSPKQNATNYGENTQADQNTPPDVLIRKPPAAIRPGLAIPGGFDYLLGGGGRRRRRTRTKAEELER